MGVNHMGVLAYGRMGVHHMDVWAYIIWAYCNITGFFSMIFDYKIYDLRLQGLIG